MDVFKQKVAVTIEIDMSALGRCSDEQLVTFWHVAQGNPASIDDEKAGELAESVGREIIRRWLGNNEPSLWHHQGRHYYWGILTANGKWGKDGIWRPEPSAGQEQVPGKG